MTEKNYRELAKRVQALRNCQKSDIINEEWEDRHLESIDSIMESSPSGSGIDCGTELLLGDCTQNKLVFLVEYHHMNENGMYDGWTSHHVTVKPSLQFGFDLKISGRNRDGIKDYLYEIYSIWLDETVK